MHNHCPLWGTRRALSRAWAARLCQSLRTQRRYFVLDTLSALWRACVLETPMTRCQCHVVYLNCRICRYSDALLLEAPASAGPSKATITSVETRMRRAPLLITNYYSLRDNDDR